MDSLEAANSTRAVAGGAGIGGAGGFSNSNIELVAEAAQAPAIVLMSLISSEVREALTPVPVV